MSGKSQVLKWQIQDAAADRRDSLGGAMPMAFFLLSGPDPAQDLNFVRLKPLPPGGRSPLERVCGISRGSRLRYFAAVLAQPGSFELCF